LYVAIAISSLAAFSIVFALSIRTGIVISSGWIGLAMWSAIIFGVVVRSRRRHWARGTFWLATAGLLTVHLLAFTVALNTYPQWRPVWFIPIAIVEAGLFGIVLDTLFERRGE
jgi:hypothetical protein